MREIWKYELEVADVQKIWMTKGAEILHVAGQEKSSLSQGHAYFGVFPMLWALIDPGAERVQRLIAVVGSGNPAPSEEDSAKYVGTAICGMMVWHVFDGGEL